MRCKYSHPRRGHHACRFPFYPCPGGAASLQENLLGGMPQNTLGTAHFWGAVPIPQAGMRIPGACKAPSAHSLAKPALLGSWRGFTNASNHGMRWF